MASTTTSSSVIDRIDRVHLRVRDIEAALSFYETVAGLEVASKSATGATLRPPGGRTVLVLSSEGVAHEADKRATGLFHTAIRYPTRRTLGEALARLVDAGYRIGAGDHGVSEALYIDDPDGNGVELYWDRPRDKWPQPTPGERIRMYTEPVDLQGLLAEAGDGVSGSAPSGTDIGHVHLQARDVDETVNFYRDVLGFDLMTMFGSQAAFLSAQGYHHHIGANVWNSRGQDPASDDHAGLARIVFAVSDEEELRRLDERLSARDVAHDVAKGSLEVRDPNGVQLEFAVASDV